MKITKDVVYSINFGVIDNIRQEVNMDEEDNTLYITSHEKLVELRDLLNEYIQDNVTATGGIVSTEYPVSPMDWYGSAYYMPAVSTETTVTSDGNTNIKYTMELDHDYDERL